MKSEGTQDTSIQVQPRFLTKAPLSEAERQLGTHIEVCCVDDVRWYLDNKWVVRACEQMYVCDIVVIANGALVRHGKSMV